MKKTMLMIAVIYLLGYSTRAQNSYDQQMQAAVVKLDRAATVKDYQRLAGDFETIAEKEKNQWLPYYYAAFCNAKIGWLYEQDGDAIEPFADKAETAVKKSQSLIDTAVQKKELSEIYCVVSMVNRARVFVNPISFGRQYGLCSKPIYYKWRYMRIRTIRGQLSGRMGEILDAKTLGRR